MSKAALGSIGDKNCGFISIGGMIVVIEGAEESCFSRMIAVIS